MIVIIGAGLAGLSTALALAPAPVLLLSQAPLGSQSSSAWAQGGIAAAIGDDDTIDLHIADTLAAGDGLSDPAVAARIVAAGPALIATLRAAGVRFDGTLGLEAAHSRRRIVHAGDSTGREVMRALAAKVSVTPSITMRAGQARRLVVDDGQVAGIVLADGAVIGARRVVIATGGIGGLYAHTTNPLGAWGQGLLLAARAGAVLTDLEFVQFHPTALDAGQDPMPLISEALRGEGAVLIDQNAERFMAGIGRAEMEPRDVVARAVWRHLAAGNRVYLDARSALGDGFAAHFPAIAGLCAQAGIDPARQPIPIRPAAHYHMGGIAVDAQGRSSIAGLFACGECAGTGLHGANRLASNSLLEAGVCGAAVAAAISGGPVAASSGAFSPRAASAPADAAPVRPIMTGGLGVLRDHAGMARAAAGLLALAESNGPASDPAAVGLMIAVSALRRHESRGAHARTDRPDHAPGATRSRITLTDAVAAAQALACVPA